MTKICGIIGATDQINVQAYLRKMVDSLKHSIEVREEFISFEKGAFAVIKSSLIDQKMTSWNADESMCFALAGHIVADDQLVFEEAGLSNDHIPVLSDTLKHDRERLDQLNGVFCVAAYDHTTKSLILVNDRYGFMPIYYYYDQDIFAFSSEAKAVLQVAKQKSFDWEAVADFFYIGHMLGQKTLFKQISALESAQILTYCNGRLDQDRYHDFTNVNLVPPAEVSTQKLASLFINAVRKRVHTDTPNTLLLSGGFDSRLILGALHNAQVAPHIISIENPRGQSKGADAQFAARIAETLGLQPDRRQADPNFLSSLRSIEVFYILDGMVPTWTVLIGAIYPEIDSDAGTVWDGLSLDVALGGSHAEAESVQKNVESFIAGRRVNRFLLRLALKPSIFRAADTTFMARLQHELHQVPATENQFTNFLLKHRTRRRIAVNPYQLYASKVEPMTPAADKDFMDYVLRIPSGMKRHHRLYVDLLRNEFPFLTHVPVISGGAVFNFQGNELQKQAPTRKSRLQRLRRRGLKALKGLTTTSARSREELLGDHESATLIIRVLEQRFFDRPIYNKALLRRLFNAYRNGNSMYHKLFKIVFYIELWHLLFMDDRSPILAELHQAIIKSE